jgi:hypothetical protein
LLLAAGLGLVAGPLLALAFSLLVAGAVVGAVQGLALLRLFPIHH